MQPTFTRRRFAGACAAAALSPAAPAWSAANPAVRKAMEAVRAGIATAEADPARPVYHFRPPAFWNNDPNGTICYRGWHHLFYQHNPFEAKWGHMHWGHARSRDLVNWEHLPIALWPSEEKGEQHVFSGGAILADDGRPRLFYTSIGHPSPEQWLAVPKDDDLIVWEKHPSNPVLTVAAHGAHQVDDWRDPFLFRASGQVYMVCGGNTSGRRWGGGGVVELYRAANRELSEWKHLGPVFEYRDRETVNIECPNLFPLGDKWVLLISPHKPCEYFVGQLDLARGRFTPETHGVLDAGNAYASNISSDGKGRTILWLWGRTKTDPKKGWNSVMVLPRILSLGAGGFLRQQPAPEFETLRGAMKSAPAAALGGKPVALDGIRGDGLEIAAEFTCGKASSVGLHVRCSAAGKPGLVLSYDARGGVFSAGTARTLVGRGSRVGMRVYLDRSVAEVYVNDGAAGADDLGVAAFAQGGTARLESLRAWPLKAARFSLEHFQA